MSSVPFEQTLLALRRDAGWGRYLVGASLLGLLAVWALAAMLLKLPVQIASSDGGIVSAGATARLLSPTDEPVKVTYAKLGQQVAAGDLLVVFDT